ncbi:probable WRKY transcription factor 24 [Typha latifolia]|uniref:probable WRKY transcription factor 24 n=1 Tax=Typha latifolia TaxID=4733 RepID=UPI003C2DC5DB
MALVGFPLRYTTTMAYSSSSINPQPDDPNPDQPAPFDLSEYIVFDETSAPPLTPPVESNQIGHNSGSNPPSSSSSSRRNEVERPRTERIAFRMKSEVEIVDDGFKWRKYGKKSVKDSPNPRNYYRCSTEGCYVKKRVERDKEDPSYVITTYEGVHNHMSPGVVYYASQDATSGRYFVAGCQIHPCS